MLRDVAKEEDADDDHVANDDPQAACIARNDSDITFGEGGRDGSCEMNREASNRDVALVMYVEEMIRLFMVLMATCLEGI